MIRHHLGHSNLSPLTAFAGLLDEQSKICQHLCLVQPMRRKNMTYRLNPNEVPKICSGGKSRKLHHSTTKYLPIPYIF